MNQQSFYPRPEPLPKHWLLRLWIPAVFVLLSSCTAGHTFYVAPGGDDHNAGSRHKPFATLRRAVEAAHGVNGKMTVYLREGTYRLENTVTVPAGTGELTISSYHGEQACLTGGVRITGFVSLDLSQSTARRIAPDIRPHVRQVDLKKLGITDYGEITPRGFGRPITPSGLELYFNGRPMPPARWPDSGWVRIGRVPEELQGRGFVYRGDRPSRWLQSKDIWMHGYWKWDWSDSYVKIAGIDTLKKEIIAAPPYGNYPFTEGKRYYVFNLPEELDAPGEWYLDRQSGILYFYPPAETETAEIFVSLLREPLLHLEDTRGVVLRDLTLEYSCGAGIVITGGQDNRISGCTIRNLGTVAVSIGRLKADLGGTIYKNTLYNGNAGTGNGVSACEIYRTGEGGILLGGGDRKTLQPGGNFVEACRIHDCSRWVRTYRAGVFMYGVGNIVRHNEIFDLPHTAVFFWGNDHTIEYNEIHHVCMETGDAGALYLGRDWTQRGSVIRYNYIHHLHGVEGESGFTDVMGVYLDDWASGTTVFGNIFYKAGRSIMIGGGRDNLVENNIIIEGMPAMHVDARGTGWATYYFNGTDNTLFERYAAVHADRPPYSVKYPQLLHIMDNHPELPVGNCFICNVSCGGRWRDLLNGLTDSLVCFKDNVHLERCDLLKSFPPVIRYDTAVFPPGFQKIPFEEIGTAKER